jgi:hypothetical protein
VFLPLVARMNNVFALATGLLNSKQVSWVGASSRFGMAPLLSKNRKACRGDKITQFAARGERKCEPPFLGGTAAANLVAHAGPLRGYLRWQAFSFSTL